MLGFEPKIWAFAGGIGNNKRGVVAARRPPAAARINVRRPWRAGEVTIPCTSPGERGLDATRTHDTEET
jgi:hypothetical protein